MAKTPLYGTIEFNPMTETDVDIGVCIDSKGWLRHPTTTTTTITGNMLTVSYDISPHIVETKLITRQCPNCGAPIGKDKLKCDYCDSCFSEVEA